MKTVGHKLEELIANFALTPETVPLFGRVLIIVDDDDDYYYVY